jgi:hypothetical protein
VDRNRVPLHEAALHREVTDGFNPVGLDDRQDLMIGP